jgi:hypothetical protein
MDALTVYTAQAIGLFEGEVIKRKTTADCLDALRKAGTIR